MFSLKLGFINNIYMNVLILTPDAVGSTLLQRLITIYMQFHNYDRPVINLHELTNGLVKYYSPEFNQELLGKKPGKWGYHQSLREVAELLDSADHYKTSRLAQYHITKRKDTLADQIPFYEYLNENFYIISCRRQNIFEHALSWTIKNVTKRLNVYSAEEKINVFFDLYQSRIEVAPETLVDQLERYRTYMQWCSDHFNIASYFQYERDLPNIENYILNLPIFAGQSNRVTWKSTYGLDFADWNRCHYMSSDIGSIALGSQEKLQQITFDKSSALGFNNSLVANLPRDHQRTLLTHGKNYSNASESIKKMVELGILITGVPIKKQTLREKKYLVKNFDACVDAYNNWIVNYPELGQPLDHENIMLAIEHEQHQWRGQWPTATSAVALLDQRTTEP